MRMGKKRERLEIFVLSVLLRIRMRPASSVYERENEIERQKSISTKLKRREQKYHHF